MKLKVKRLLVFSLIFTLLFGVQAFAYTTINYKEVKKHAEEFLKSHKINRSIKSPIKLYNFENEVEFLKYSIEDGGYIIINVKNYKVPEFSPENDNKFIDSEIEKYYYGGVLTYLKASEDELIDTATNQPMGTLSQLKAQKKLPFDTTIPDETPQIQAMSGNTEEFFLNGTLETYSHNPNGICGSVASAIYLRYFDEHHNSNYVPAELDSSTEVELIRALIPYIDGRQALDEKQRGGSSPEKLRSGLQRFLRDHGVSDSIYCSNSNRLNRVKERISNNKPFIVDLDRHPTYKEHWVIAHGYVTDSVIGSSVRKLTYIIVNDGWGSNNIYVDMDYVNYLVW